jgi:hypothetical protein
MTTLTNPTDAELNDCFAKHVCWLELHSVDDFSGERSYRRLDGHVMVMEHGGFLKSMDAVLPWLNKTSCEFGNAGPGWRAEVVTREGGYGTSLSEDLPSACVLALLKAHGVGVVYGASSKTELQ